MLLIVLVLLVPSSIYGHQRCPFNPDCWCVPSSPPDLPTSFHRVDCRANSSTLPRFETSPSGNKYVVTDTLAVVGFVAELPADYLIAFDSVYTLSLIQSPSPSPSTSSSESPPPPIYERWDSRAFSSVRLVHLDVSGLAGLVPPPDAIVRSNLRRFSIRNAGEPIELDDSSFLGLSTLKSLWIRQTQVLNVSDSAFHGLESTLEELSLNGIRQSEYPWTAVRRLKKLKTLSLDQNAMITLPAKSFSTFANLSTLSLGGNPINISLIQSATNHLPSQLARLYLDSTGLTAVPRGIFVQQSSISTLSLTNNRIERIRKADFVGVENSLEELLLNSNPIRSVQAGSFDSLTNLTLIDLRNTNMSRVDLSVLARSPALANLFLDASPYLEVVEVSNVDAFTSSASSLLISITNCGLRTLDKTLDELLRVSEESTDSTIIVDISNNGNLICDESIEWMAEHVLCTGRVRVDRCTCDLDDQPLVAYLRQIAPDLEMCSN